MKTKEDMITHVSGATGTSAAEVEKVLDAALGFLRQSVKDVGGFTHPAMGLIRRVEREAKDGTTRTVYRYRPDAGAKAPATGKGGGGKGSASGGARAGAGKRDVRGKGGKRANAAKRAARTLGDTT